MFDTVDHEILLERLNLTWIPVTSIIMDENRDPIGQGELNKLVLAVVIVKTVVIRIGSTSV